MFRQRGLQMCRGLRRLCSTMAEDGMAVEKSKAVLTGERSVNNVTLLGRVGRDPEMRGTEENPLTLVSLATSQSYKRGEEYTQHTEWHRVVVFRPGLREMVAQNVSKGDRIYVEGSVKYREYTPQDSSTTVRVTSIVADNVILVSKRKNNED